MKINSFVYSLYESIVSFNEKDTIKIDINECAFNLIEKIDTFNLTPDDLSFLVNFLEVIEYEPLAPKLYETLIKKLKEKEALFLDFQEKVNQKIISKYLNSFSSEKSFELSLSRYIFEKALVEKIKVKMKEESFFNDSYVRNKAYLAYVSIAFPLFDHWVKLNAHTQCTFWKIMIKHPQKKEFLEDLLKDATNLKIYTENKMANNVNIEKVQNKLNREHLIKEKILLEALIDSTNQKSKPIKV